MRCDQANSFLLVPSADARSCRFSPLPSPLWLDFVHFLVRFFDDPMSYMKTTEQLGIRLPVTIASVLIISDGMGVTKQGEGHAARSVH